MILKLLPIMIVLVGCGSSANVSNDNDSGSQSNNGSGGSGGGSGGGSSELERTYECQTIDGDWEETHGGCHLKAPLNYGISIPVGSTLTFTLLEVDPDEAVPTIVQNCYDLVHRGYSDWYPFSNFGDLIQYPEGLSLLDQLPDMYQLWVTESGMIGDPGFGYYLWTSVLDYYLYVGVPGRGTPEYQICMRYDT